MEDSVGARWPEDWSFSKVLLWPSPAQRAVCLLVLIVLMLLGTTIVYITGGTAYAYPYLMLIPVLFAAAWYGVSGGLLAGVAAGALMALIPLDVKAELMQSPVNWLLRLFLYVVLGMVAGGLFQALRSSFHAHELLLRTDPRSKLPNQISLNEDLAQWVPLSRDRRVIGLIVVRISDIADVLEAMGADASDELAAKVGARLNQVVKEEGGVYRFSISELAILLSARDSEHLRAIVGKIIEAGEENIIVQDVPVRVQLVVGSTWRNDDQISSDDLIREARLALFSAIKRKLSYCEYTSALTQKTLTTIKLISSVSRGLDQGEFELHYQPKVTISQGTIYGCEALIRWRDAQHGIILPGKFMPKVENTTLIGPVTQFVSRQCCKFLTGCSQQVSLNFSARNLVDGDMPDFLQALVTEYGVSAERIEIEVTESALIQNLDAARYAIERMREIGFGVSIDDFGTGFASFDYLRRLPITGIKIDRAFVRDLENDERSQKLMACMVDVGHALDLTVTAEGVETQGQYDVLKALGCDQAQGFYFTPALPAEQYLTWCAHYYPTGA